jgi:hypothetical protein
VWAGVCGRECVGVRACDWYVVVALGDGHEGMERVSLSDMKKKNEKEKGVPLLHRHHIGGREEQRGGRALRPLAMCAW